jgi:hypothetical protein
MGTIVSSMFARAYLLLAALLAPTTARAEDAAATFGQLVLQYHCAVVDRLQQIDSAFNASHPQNWFLIVYFADNPNDYVQCVFDTRTRMLCEAASGFYDKVASEPRARWLSADAVAALARLGFSTDDSAGNFRIWFNVTDPPDLNHIADFIPKALHDGYRARADTKLNFNAPLAPHATSKCVPVS